MASQEFDYIIVGAGSAGCVLANRLSADGSKVLLLEAGGRDTNPLIHIPLGMGKMHEYGMHDWGYHTEPEPNLNNRTIEAARGKVLGGSSSINVMAYTRGHRGDYDRWAQKGCKGWSYADILPYFKRGETFADGGDTWRGGDGPLQVQFASTRDPLFDAWITFTFTARAWRSRMHRAVMSARRPALWRAWRAWQLGARQMALRRAHFVWLVAAQARSDCL